MLSDVDVCGRTPLFERGHAAAVEIIRICGLASTMPTRMSGVHQDAAEMLAAVSMSTQPLVRSHA